MSQGQNALVENLWKTCGKAVDKSIPLLPSQVIHIFFHRLIHRFSTGFAQGIFLYFKMI
jgi:hypothetical protein